MPDSISHSSFKDLLCSNTPLLDVRAAIEYDRGALPNSFNVPLLNDKQRERVGTVYKEQGREEAIALGYKLIDSDKKAQRIAQWEAFIEKHPDSVLYCFRGGQRSQITQLWLKERGLDIPRIEGGFKSVRQFLIKEIERATQQHQFLIAGGKTGCGKTHLINKLKSSIDLEGRANHRGSAFGRRVSAQPNQINFENTLALDFLTLAKHEPQRIFIEDESHSIGSIHLPPVLHEKMKKSPLAIIESTVEERTSVIFNDYIHDNYMDFVAGDSVNGYRLFSDSLLSSLEKIKRRLGGELYSEIKKLMEAALNHHSTSGDGILHRDWIKLLLIRYYDPMYDYQLGKKSDRIVFRGNSIEFIDWAKHLSEKNH
ncbi:MAG: tRNA 2-selenouridine(34) synthase MnmH [Pseudohongiellaceae bacterium]